MKRPCIPVVSAGEELPLPLDSCCSQLLSLVSGFHADFVAPKRPQLNYQSLEKPVAVSVADPKAQLQTACTMAISIQWNNGKEITFQMLVVPSSWSFLSHSFRGEPFALYTGLGGSF